VDCASLALQVAPVSYLNNIFRKKLVERANLGQAMNARESENYLAISRSFSASK
jgi:hypothetical protein